MIRAASWTFVGSALTLSASWALVACSQLPPSAPPPTGLPNLEATQCADQSDALCANLAVPLDYGDPGGQQLHLLVRLSTSAPPGAPTLLLLDGGPGLGDGKSLLQDRLDASPELAQRYRIAVIETRGTGGTALNCPKLQENANAVSADVMPVPPGLISGCGKSLGSSRQFYTTADTVADIDVYRRALGIESWSIMGVSYGTFVAQRYAIAHPDNTDKVVLDSVVPQDGGDPFYAASLRGSGDVMRQACAAHNCGYDPASDLQTLLGRGTDGVPIFNALLADTYGKPVVYPLVEALHAAVSGDTKPLQRQTRVRHGNLPSAEEFSAALLYATVCTDMHYPWGNSASPVDGRMAAAQAEANALPVQDLLPFDARTAAGQGAIVNCEPWPVTPAADNSGGAFPDTPTLLINGEWDLLTPASDARAQAAKIPHSELVIVPEWGHVAIATKYGAEKISEFLLR